MIEDKAVIGVTCSDRQRGRPYSDMVEKYGAEVRYIMPGEARDLKEVSRQIDGLLIAGGADVHPSWYGEQPEVSSRSWYNEALDDLEVPLLSTVLSSDTPVLAICRGMQVLNVAMGGKLAQSIDGHNATSEENGERDSSYHRIFISPGCRLSSTVGSGGFVRVNSRHHQGIMERHKSKHLMSSAWSMEDGVIEALESPEHDWVLGVQFHPERRGELPPHFDKLFETLVRRAKSTI